MISDLKPLSRDAAEISVGWEFDRDGDAEGWQIQSDLTELRVADGTLRTIVTGDAARISGPDLNIAAEDNGFIVIRMKVLRTRSAILRWDSDSSPLGFFNFEVEGDGLFHEYEIPLHTAPGWQGNITRLQHITFLKSLPGTELEIDYIRIIRLGVRLEIEKFRVKRIVPLPGEHVPVELIVRNSGDVGGAGHVRLTLPSGLDLVHGDAAQDVGPMAVAANDTARWIVLARETGEFRITGETLLAGDIHVARSIVLPVVAERWEQKEFLLTAWSPPFVFAKARPRNLGYYGEANFETLLWVPPAVSIVDSVAKYNMRCLVNVGSIVSNHTLLRAENNQVPPKLEPEHFAKLDEIIDKFLGNPAVIGYFITDEPNHKAFDNLSDIVAHIRRRDPTRLSYINQHPSSAGPTWFGPRSYRELLEHYLDVIKLELLSYDRYTFFRNDDGPSFFQDLATVRQVALDYDVPFANIVQAIGDEADLGLPGWRIPNQAEHRWLAYNSLAYGARSLIWFHWNSEWGVTGSVARDELFASIQSVNAEVNVLGPYMMQLRSVGAYHVGEIPLGAVALPDTVLVRSVAADADMAVGLFEDESGNDYFMIVNDYHKAVTATIALARETDQLLTLDVATGAVRPVDFEVGVGGAVFGSDYRPGAGRLYFFGVPTLVETEYEPVQPVDFALRQNYPNPFNPATTITYDLVDSGPVKLTVYDALGQVVDVLIDRRQPAGRHSVRWTASEVASGVYVYALESGGQVLRRKMALLR